MQQKQVEPNNWALLPMKSVTKIASIGFAVTGGTLLTLVLLFFINVLANYHPQNSEPRPLLVVGLTAWPVPFKQEQQQPTPPKQQPVPEKPALKKTPLPKPEPSPQTKKVVKELPAEAVEHEPKEEITEEVEKTVEQTPSEPTPPMLIEPTEEALPTPMPIFKLTQAPRFLHRQQPFYPETMRTQGISGTVRLEALIDKKGRVREVNILKSAGTHFDQAAKQAILDSIFYPAEVEGEAVAVLLRLPVTFNLR